MIRISIVTPSFNQGQFIEETITSVLSQNYGAVEYIIIDGGSTDNTVEVIQEYADRLAYWVSEPDRGQTHAINKGFERATGEVIAWLNSDDLYCSDALAIVGAYFADHPECMWLCGNIMFADEYGTVFARKKPIYSTFISRHGSSSLYQPNVFVRRSILDEVGFLREDFHLMMDKEWFCRIACKYPPHIIDKDLALFRWHSSSKSSTTNGTALYKRYLEERIMVSTHYAPFLKPYLRVMPRQVFFLQDQLGRVLKAVIRLKKICSKINGHME
jgi:glycosyltransferase involved in cell wall biosynthesis